MTGNNAVALIDYMLKDVRRITLKGVEGLTKEQLFAAPLPGEFPIGSYLLHLCEVDIHWFEVLSQEKLPDELRKKIYYDNWYDSTQKEPSPPKEPLEPEEYLELIAETRQLFLDYLTNMTDEDLEQSVPKRIGDHSADKISKKWILYHMIEHEAHHRGQMFMLIRMSKLKTPGENN